MELHISFFKMINVLFSEPGSNCITLPGLKRTISWMRRCVPLCLAICFISHCLSPPRTCWTQSLWLGLVCLESQTFRGTWAHTLLLYTGYSVHTSTGNRKAHPHRGTLPPTKPHLLMVPLPRSFPQNVSKAVINGILVGFFFEWTTSLVSYK